MAKGAAEEIFGFFNMAEETGKSTLEKLAQEERKEEMLLAVIDRIRGRARKCDYFPYSHAEDEMAEDGFERADEETAILGGIVDKKLTHVARGTPYRLEGPAEDGRLMKVMRRFRENRSLVIITVYDNR